MLPEVVGNGSQARQEQECDERRLAPDLDRDDRRQRQPDVTDWRRNVRQPKPAGTKVDDAGRTDQEEVPHDAIADRADQPWHKQEDTPYPAPPDRPATEVSTAAPE